MEPANELTRPLGLDRPARPASRPVARLAVAGGALGLLGCAAAAFLYRDGLSSLLRREPPSVQREAERRPAPSLPERPAPEPSRQDASQLERTAGVSVVRPDGTGAPSSVIVRVPDEGLDTLAPAPDPRLSETTRHGILPRLGPEGEQASLVYARRPGELPGGARPAARVAIVVGGLGISSGSTADAIARLPGAVTLAFAPYGAELERDVARARGDGHEVVLQVAMEPFDYPASNPGPRTLTASARPAENLDNLHWAMGRFSGYVALMNYMGGKLTADAKALTPIVAEAGRRGVAVLDDGSSSRSLIGSLPGAHSARADLVLDAQARADSIDKALERLEAAASGGRIALGTASALPVTIDRIERWAKGLEARGVLLVPASAAFLNRPPESARR